MPEEVLVWPAFINSELSRSKGRRLARKYCVRNPKAEELLDAAMALGIKARIAKKAFPRMWNLERKALVIEERVSRSSVLPRLAEEVHRSRSE